jgi:uncharacterized membrane protein YphA (DoxX/SURF4 family)
MQSKTTNNIIYWALTACVSLIFLASAFGKLTGNAEALKKASEFGFDSNAYRLLGVVECVSLLLFIIPRTGVLGTLLLVAYMGGAIATHLQHSESIVVPCIIQVFLCIVASYRFPELRTTLLNSNS